MPYLPSHLCEHPNEVPHVCPCVFDCFCRSTSCPAKETSPVPQPLRAVDRLLADELWIVRLWDMFDGWVDVSEPIPQTEAQALWNERTKDGTQNTKFEDGDYYRVFPADTRMLITPEFTGR